MGSNLQAIRFRRAIRKLLVLPSHQVTRNLTPGVFWKNIFLLKAPELCQVPVNWWEVIISKFASNSHIILLACALRNLETSGPSRPKTARSSAGRMCCWVLWRTPTCTAGVPSRGSVFGRSFRLPGSLCLRCKIFWGERRSSLWAGALIGEMPNVCIWNPLDNLQII